MSTELVLAIVRRVLGQPEVGPDDDLFDRGCDSLAFARIGSGIGRELGVAVLLTDLFDSPTPRAIARIVDAAGRY